MKRRFENILITVAAALIGFSVIGFDLANRYAPDIVPAPAFSDLESRYYAERPDFEMDSFMEGDYQRSLNDYLADRVPVRNQAMLFNAALQRTSTALSAVLLGFDVFPTYFGSHYYVVPRDGIIVDRAETQPSDNGGKDLDAWVNTLNEAARKHPDVHFVYDCVARHDQTEANPTYRFYDDRLNPTWIRENLIDRLDPRIDSFIDAVESYDEIAEEWLPADPHWTLKRALESYNQVAARLSLAQFAYEDPVVVVDGWYGSYAKNGLDLDVSAPLEDLPIDFTQLTFYELQEDGGAERQMGQREDVLNGSALKPVPGDSEYYLYFGGGSTRAVNEGPNNGRKALLVADSLSYCLTRFIASNYSETTILLPGNSSFDSSLESYIDQYGPDDVIVLMHATKYQMVAAYSPAFIGLD